jgi:hypothetical protein
MRLDRVKLQVVLLVLLTLCYLLPLPACTDADDLDGNTCEELEEENEGYMQLNIELPNSSTTRSGDEESLPTDPGTTAEANVTSARIYLFADGKAYSGNPIDVRLLLLHTGAQTTYQSELVKAKIDSYHAYLLINNTADYSAYALESDFRNLTSAAFTEVQTPESTAANGIPMSSRDNSVGAYTEITLTSLNTSNNPARLTMSVERSWAKITFANNVTSFPLYITTYTTSNSTLETEESSEDGNESGKDVSDGTGTSNDVLDDSETNTQTDLGTASETNSGTDSEADLGINSETNLETDSGSNLGANSETNEEEGEEVLLGSVDLEGYSIINVPSEYYLFRHVGLLDGAEPLTPSYGAYYTAYKTEGTATSVTSYYVYDPYSTQKKYTAAALTCPTKAYLSRYSVGGLEGAAAVKASDLSFSQLSAAPADGTTIFGYVPENVMSYHCQKKGYATGLVFKARIKPNEVYALTSTATPTVALMSDDDRTAYLEQLSTQGGKQATTLYFYLPARRFYNSIDALLTDNKLTDDITSAILKDATRRNRFGIYYYEGGVCYYPYYLRHYAPTESEKTTTGRKMQAMEYAIVRNNEYRLTISRVTLRAAEDLNIDPTEDVLLTKVYLDATIKVAPWVTESNDMTLGGF